MHTMTTADQKTTVNCIITGRLKVNTFFISSENSVVVIDPGGDPAKIIAEIRHYPNILLLLTHCHYDHSGAVNEVYNALPQSVFAAHPACIRRGQSPQTNLSRFLLDTEYIFTITPDFIIAEDQTLHFHEITLQTFHSTGHSAGHLCYLLPAEDMVFCGDMLTADDIGRHDVPGSCLDSMIHDCRRLLSMLPDTMLICPGHGRTISAREVKETNPRLQRYYR